MQHPVARLTSVIRRIETAVGGTRADDGGAYAVLPHLFRERFRETDDSELRGAVDRARCRTNFPGDRSNIDDVSFASLDHRRKNKAAGVEDASQIGVDHCRE